MSIENINDHLAFVCECGSTKFCLLKSGGIECAQCLNKQKSKWHESQDAEADAALDRLAAVLFAEVEDEIVDILTDREYRDIDEFIKYNAITSNDHGRDEADYIYVDDMKNYFAELRQEEEALCALIEKQSALLTGVANALRGEPPELRLWSHHDLPELARKIKLSLLHQSATIESANNRIRALIDECNDLGIELEAVKAIGSQNGRSCE